MKKQLNLKNVTRFVWMTCCVLLLMTSCGEDDGAILPEISISPFDTSIDENPQAGKTLGTVSATTTTGVISFAIESQTEDGAIAINSSTGELTVENASAFDYEVNPMLSATISASVGGVSETAVATIALKDVAESISADDFALTINENPENGFTLGSVSASSDGSDSLKYSLVSGTFADAFAIDSKTGELSVADSSYFDFEVNPTLTAMYEVGAGGITQRGSITITLTDVQELTILARDFIVSFDENPNVNDVVGSVNVTVSNGSGTVVYAIESLTVPNALTINASGDLIVSDPTVFDYEQNLEIRGKYSASVGNIVGEGAITIFLNDVDERSVVATDFVGRIAENSTQGTFIGTATATLTGGLANLRFELLTQSIPDAVSIHTDGTITVSDPSVFDYEVNPQITGTFEVLINGGTSPNRSSVGSFTIDLNDKFSLCQCNYLCRDDSR